MQFSYAAVAAFMATAVSAHGYNTSSPVWVTDVVTAYTTYCPYATQVTLGGKTYTVTEVRFGSNHPESESENAL
jgi:hypothetical protein